MQVHFAAAFVAIHVLLGDVVAHDGSTALPSTLNITATWGNSQQESILQCWQLSAPFQTSSAQGFSGDAYALLGSSVMSYLGVIPAHHDGGLHTAPAQQYIALLSGKAVISLPNSSQIAVIYGGKHGLFYAGDTSDKSRLGHETRYPSSEDTVGVVLPQADGLPPLHTVLHDGPCDVNYEQMF